MKRPAWSGFRGGRANPIVCGRKFCARCGRWRPVSDFGRQPGNTLTGLYSYCQACVRAVRREWWRAAPREAIERHLEYHRIYNEVKRREAGMAVRNLKRPSVVDRPEYVFLPREPLAIELDRWLECEGTFYNLAELAGVSERAIYRIRYGESRRVRIDVADRLAYALGIPSAILFGKAWEGAA